jgi:hypothetical protein
MSTSARSGGNRSGSFKADMAELMNSNKPARFNEPTEGMVKQRIQGPSMAFGSKPPNGKKALLNKPPLARNKNQIDGFDKKDWIREHRMIKKDINIEERDRFRPLMCMKHDF